MLCSVGLLGGSGVALWAQTNRHGGYADLGTATYSVPGYAIASDTIGLHLATGAVSDLIGTVRIQVTQDSGTAPVFIGIAPADAAARYLAGVDYATVRGAVPDRGYYLRERSAIRETGRIGQGNAAPAVEAPEAVYDGGGPWRGTGPWRRAAASRRGYRWRIGLASSE